ncbi:DpnD/PcfM family protein [Pelotomaculum sp. FP]|uniref:DpnD/PcfM family protein n=1 Tax=Pelotomaculum sp. FP TaxID=261474 RepID=UPI001FAA0951|nr:DpnD/PcfM family protein [Pelotomaculum sp. FP]
MEIKETLCMTVEIGAKDAEQAEAIVRAAYKNEDYILDAEHFTGVDFSTHEKEMNARSKEQKHRGQER